MGLSNETLCIVKFIIGGLDTTKSPFLVGMVVLIIYVVGILANLVNILVIIYDKRLHKPMYLLICNLAVVDIMFTSSASPTIIRVLVASVKTISYVPCLIQMFVFQLGWVMEMFALAVMAFDRLIAVSRPFHYHSYLTNSRTLVLTYILWIVACGFVTIFPATVIPLPHCYTVLKYAYCDYAAVIRTTCVDPNYYFNMVAIILFFLLFFTFGFISLSYVGIIFFVKLSSNNEKKKIGSTCLSHLIVVTCYYFPVFVLVVLTRLVNPFVYSLRTKEIKCKIIKMFRKAYFSELTLITVLIISSLP
uniref:G-protein coupled receptors family 1 profile domain-containing protein n=1 Tax=Anabas testudineus TaxID=64144 RepID=A0A3Q1IIW6_ANATE